jgi:multidrug resistance protein MdtO
MKTASAHLPHAARFTTWFPDFLRKELAPYPGRGAIVARMVIAATISAILIVTFRIPGGAIGVLCAFVFSREDLLATARSALALVAAFAGAGLFIPVGARLFASTPITHFFWEGASIFAIFFLLRTFTNFALASGISLVATNILAIWYLPGPAARNVSLTLWQVASAGVGALVTLAVELVFHALHHQDEVLSGVDARLKQIEILMRAYASGTPPSEETMRLLSQYAVVGMGSLRRHIARTADNPVHRMRMSALVSLTGRSTDFAAALSNSTPYCDAIERPRTEMLAQRIGEIRACLASNQQPSLWEAKRPENTGTPLLTEMEAMISLIPSVLIGESATDPRLHILETPVSSNRLFIQDAFTNPEHLRYALSGTLAAMLCYIFYVSLAWPGLATSVTTCVLTGLTNIGASRQKQVLRLAGALLGGLIFGMGAQVFVLPYIDSVAGFAMMMAVVSAIAAWVSTSSSRLSYAGVQIALAFYLIHLSDFTIQTSLTVARDRLIGVLLGTFMMWLVFERFYRRPAVDQMIRIFTRNLRLMAEMIMSAPADGDSEAIVRIRRQRDQIYRYFGEVNAQADAVPFETGPQRAADMAARDRIRRWQASLRTFYLLETPLLQFRIFSKEAEKVRPFAQIENQFREECAQAFLNIARALEDQLDKKPLTCDASHLLLTHLDAMQSGQDEFFSERERALLTMSRTIASLVDRVHGEVATEPLFSTE